MTGDKRPEMTLTADNELRLEGQEGGETLSQVGEKAKEMARRTGDEVREGLGAARDAAAEHADATIDRAAEEVARTARALGEAAGGLEGGMPQGLLREASQGLERLSGAMRGAAPASETGLHRGTGRARRFIPACPRSLPYLAPRAPREAAWRAACWLIQNGASGCGR